MVSRRLLAAQNRNRSSVRQILDTRLGLQNEISVKMGIRFDTRLVRGSLTFFRMFEQKLHEHFLFRKFLNAAILVVA